MLCIGLIISSTFSISSTHSSSRSFSTSRSSRSSSTSHISSSTSSIFSPSRMSSISSTSSVPSTLDWPCHHIMFVAPAGRPQEDDGHSSYKAPAATRTATTPATTPPHMQVPPNIHPPQHPPPHLPPHSHTQQLIVGLPPAQTPPANGSAIVTLSCFRNNRHNKITPATELPSRISALVGFSEEFALVVEV